MGYSPRITLLGLALLAAAPLVVAATAIAGNAQAEDLGYTEEVLKPGEIDPNDLAPGEEMPMPGDVRAKPSQPKETIQAISSPLVTPEATHQAAEVMEVDSAPVSDTKPAKRKKSEAKLAQVEKPKPREIPLIETKNEGHSHEDVTFVTGGIGEEEREAIEAAKGDYNLHVTNASKDGAFEGDARVIITQQGAAEGDEMLDVVAGPLLYVRLPTGKYTAMATMGERVITKNFEVKRKGQPVEVRLSW